MSTLHPIGTRVVHDGHGLGTIKAYNNAGRAAYIEENLTSPEAAIAVAAGLGEAIISSFYSADRFPYVIKFDPSKKYPEGYEDVYDVDGYCVKLLTGAA